MGDKTKLESPPLRKRSQKEHTPQTTCARPATGEHPLYISQEEQRYPKARKQRMLRQQPPRSAIKTWSTRYTQEST